MSSFDTTLVMMKELESSITNCSCAITTIFFAVIDAPKEALTTVDDKIIIESTEASLEEDKWKDNLGKFESGNFIEQQSSQGTEYRHFNEEKNSMASNAAVCLVSNIFILVSSSLL